MAYNRGGVKVRYELHKGQYVSTAAMVTTEHRWMVSTLEGEGRSRIGNIPLHNLVGTRTWKLEGYF